MQVRAVSAAPFESAAIQAYQKFSSSFPEGMVPRWSDMTTQARDAWRAAFRSVWVAGWNAAVDRIADLRKEVPR
jgi:hypothetical protein